MMTNDSNQKADVVYPRFVGEDFENKIFTATMEEYHGMRDAVHSSSLKNILKSNHAYNFFLRNPMDQTRSLRLGSIAHSAILEGAEFLNRYVVQPVFKGLTKDGKSTTSLNSTAVKEQVREWMDSLPSGTEILSQEEYDRLRFMLDSLLEHRFVYDLLKDGTPELKKVWRDPKTGLLSVSSDDFVSFQNDIWADIKTTQNCEWDYFRKSVERYRYDFQCAFYDRGIKAAAKRSLKDRIWIAIENTKPYECRVHYVDPFYMESGEVDVDLAYSKLAKAIKSNNWKQHQNVIEVGEASKFFKDKYSEIILQNMGE